MAAAAVMVTRGGRARVVAGVSRGVGGAQHASVRPGRANQNGRRGNVASRLNAASVEVRRGVASVGRRFAEGKRLRLQAHAESTYIMVKPDGVQRGLVGEIISRFERKGYTLKGLQMCICDKAKAEEHYKDLAGKPFFPNLVEYICSGPVVCMIWEGTDVVKAGRNLIGVTNPTDAAPGTIRGDFGVEVGRNLVHGSDSIENGAREIALWFGSEEAVEWEPTMTPWIKELN